MLHLYRQQSVHPIDWLGSINQLNHDDFRTDLSFPLSLRTPTLMYLGKQKIILLYVLVDGQAEQGTRIQYNIPNLLTLIMIAMNQLHKPPQHNRVGRRVSCQRDKQVQDLL